MWDECERYSESVVRTNKLWCSDCGRRIRKGETVVFCVDTRTERMKTVHCGDCRDSGLDYMVTCDTQHPFDLDG